MSKETNIHEEEVPQPSPEEIKQMRASMQTYYKEQLPLVKVQAEYEKYLADIEEARARRISMSIRIAQMMAPPSEPENAEDTPKKERKLKVQE